MEKRVLVILGSARNDSNTLKALKEYLPFKNFDLVELNKINLRHYDYEDPPTDLFLSIADKMIHHDSIVFATPVYWYAMSGVMKVFFDRLTELISTSKSMGKALAGKETYLFATGSDAELPEGFEVPFRRTSEYFDMKYQKAFYYPM